MKTKHVSVIIFPGSNCDNDTVFAFQKFQHVSVSKVWHKSQSLPNCDTVVLPGGFSYGDYLRTGAIAGKSPIMREIIKHGKKGKFILGICNGFQILLESGLLKGALLKNTNQKFICKPVCIRVENNRTAFTSLYLKDQVLTIPIAHSQGNYFATKSMINELEEKELIAFRYVNDQNSAIEEANPNGSANNIAGIYNDSKNILGLMPHPERACDPLLGMTDGQKLLQSLIES